jgi:hypothetical protein
LVLVNPVLFIDLGTLYGSNIVCNLFYLSFKI